MRTWGKYIVVLVVVVSHQATVHIIIHFTSINIIIIIFIIIKTRLIEF